MAHDVATGIIEFIMDHFTEESEGTYTCQITDGGGKAQSSLVLIGNGKRGQCLLLSHKTCSIQLHSTKKKEQYPLDCNFFSLLVGLQLYQTTNVY